MLNEMLSINPCFDVYQVATTCPLLWDVLGFPGSMNYLPEGTKTYFDRQEVKRAIHASEETKWEECASKDVFVNGEDNSDPSTWRVLPHVIDATRNVIIGHGILDMILLPNGTLLSIQNMTWGGQLGFQSPPVEPFFVPFHTLSTAAEIFNTEDQTALGSIAAAGVMGTAHEERGLTYVAINMAGHMVPQYTPSAAFRQLEVLLGRIPSLNSTQAFTLPEESKYPQPDAADLGNGTGPSTFDVPASGGAEVLNGQGKAEEDTGTSAGAGVSISRLLTLVPVMLVLCAY